MSPSKLEIGVLVLAAIMVVVVVVEAENCVVGSSDTNYWAILGTNPIKYPLSCSGGRTVDTLVAGDTLEFKHASTYNVVKVSSEEYDMCQTNSTAGSSTIALETGMNYFMCTTKYEHCKTYGMKIYVNVK